MWFQTAGFPRNAFLVLLVEASSSLCFNQWCTHLSLMPKFVAILSGSSAYVTTLSLNAALYTTRRFHCGLPAADRWAERAASEKHQEGAGHLCTAMASSWRQGSCHLMAARENMPCVKIRWCAHAVSAHWTRFWAVKLGLRPILEITNFIATDCKWCLARLWGTSAGVSNWYITPPCGHLVHCLVMWMAENSQQLYGGGHAKAKISKKKKLEGCRYSCVVNCQN